MDASFREGHVITKWITLSANQIKKCLMVLKEIRKPPHSSLNSRATVLYHNEPNAKTEKEDAQLIQTKLEINRIAPGMCHITDNIQMGVKAVKLLDEAITFHQTDYIAQARTKLQDLSTIILSTELGSRNFTIPTRYGWEVLNRGKELFLENDVSCSVKHGIIVLDSGNAQFYVSLLNIFGAFAMEISEFKVAEETFSILIELHGKSDVTSRLRDTGAAYNNRGCLSLIMGQLNQADSDFKNSLKHLNCAKQKQVHGFSVDPMIIAVRSNVSRLNLISRNFLEGLKEQEQLVESCKTKLDVLPIQTIFMVLQNEATLYTTLGIFSKAEKELKWLTSYCKGMKREICDLLLNFVSLQLCEVLLLRGKPKEAERVFPLEALTSSSVHELMATFEGLHFNVRMEAFDKMIDVLVLSGRIKFARDFLSKGMAIVKNGFGPDHLNFASLLYKEGTILKLMGEVSSSMKKFEQSGDTLRKIFGEIHPLLIKCYMSLGDVAFRLGETNESYLYFQRAMENVELIHKVSFVDNLSMKYIEITGNSKHIANEMSQGDKKGMLQEQMIEGLVAEYGPAIAVLLSRQESYSSEPPRGKQLLYTENSAKVQYSESVLLISQKSIRDFLKSGQTLLRQEMRKDAVAFFQQASKYCQAYDDLQCHPNASLVRLYSIISHTCLIDQSKTNNHALNSYLEELKEVTANSGIEDGPERNSEDMEKLTFDSQLNLKLMLIFLILFTIQLKMYETTFAAHDLYSQLSPNDDTLLLTLNDDLRVYVSRTSVTCNGKTIVQDVLVSSTIDLNKSNSERNHPEKPLFKSLACRNNVPSDTFLVTCNTSGILDIDELQLLDKKILRSVQEYIQVKSFEGEREGTATQVIVDLTSTCSNERNVLLTGSRIELLSLCLSKQGDADEICNERSNISVISSGLCEKISCMTFADEPTSCFMFSKISLRLLQERNSGTISTLMLQNQCLIVTVVVPVKARITLWYEDRSIKQKIQIISAEEGNHLSDGASCEESMVRGAIDRFFAPTILRLETTRQVACETVVVRRQCSYSLEPQVALDELREPNGILWNGFQLPQQFSQRYTEENEESARKCLNACTLECLTAISEISRQLHGDAIPEEDDIKIAVEPSRAETGYPISLPNHETTSSPPAQHNISNDFQQLTFDHESDAGNRNVSMLMSPGSVTKEGNELSFTETDTKIDDGDDLNVSITTQANTLPLKEKDTKIENSNDANDAVTTEANELSLKESDTKIEDSDDANVLGRTLFEEQRQSRSSFFAKLLEDLKKKRASQNMNPLEDSEGCSVETTGDEILCVEESSRVETHDHRNNENGSVVCGIERADSWQKSKEENEEDCTNVCENTNVIDEKETLGVLQMRREKETGAVSMTTSSAKPVNDATRLEATDENPKDVIGTVSVNILPKPTVANDISKEATGVSQNECKTGFLNDAQMHHKKVNDLEMNQRGTVHGKDVDARYTEIGPVERNGAKESVVPENETIFQSKSKNNLHDPTEKTSGPHFKEGNDALTDGLCDQDVTNFHGSKTGSGSLVESDIGDLPVKGAESDLQSYAGNFPCFEGKVWNCERSKNADTYSGPNQNTANRESDQLQLLCTRSEVRVKDGMETSSPFFGSDVVADGNTTNASPQTTQKVVDGPVSTTENRLKGYPKIAGMGLKGGQVIKRERSVHDVEKISELELNRNLGLVPFENGDMVDGTTRASQNNSYMFSDFGGARPKQVLPRCIENTGASTRFMDPIPTEESENNPLGLDPGFLARHSVTNSSLSPSFHFLNYNGAGWEDPLPDVSDDHYVSVKPCNNLYYDGSLSTFCEGSLQRSYKPRSNSPRSAENKASTTGGSMQGRVHSGAIYHTTPLKQDESWHFPPLPTDTENYVSLRSFPQSDFYSDDQECATQQNLTQVDNALFDNPEFRSAYKDRVSMTNEFNDGNNSHGENTANSVGDNHLHSVAVSEGQQNSTVDSTASLLVHLGQTMAKTVNLLALTGAAGKHVKLEQQTVEKVGIQEQASEDGENEHTETARRDPTTPLPRNERTVDVNREREERPAPVQESPRPVCGHYERRCLVRFPCCERYYPCHRCHNESKACSDDQARAINATHIRCTICYHDQVIDEGSQKCHNCNSKMSDYFCAICKHFTSVDKNPFHCEKCGICRIHSDKSFHCDVCNVCLDKRLEGKHKCRPDSGHDECCICLEDAFSGCQILPCSHKVHKDCAIAMIQNGVRTCPICRHPLFQQLDTSTQ